MTETEKLYELAYWLSPEINESEIQNSAEKIKKMIAEAGGAVVFEMPAQKRKIGQMIKKFHFGYFGIFHFRGEPDKIDELKNNIKSESKILRHMIVARKTKAPPRKKKKETFLKVLKKPREAAFEKLPAQPAIKPEKLEPEKEKVQMEELEKKLEEILKE